MDAQQLFTESQRLLESGDAQGCITEISQDIEIGESSSAHFLTRAVAYMLLEKYNEALVDCNEALRMDPENKRVYFVRGAVCRRMGKVEDAIANLDQAIEIHPDFNIAYLERALCLMEFGNFPAAEKDLRTALTYSETALKTYCDSRGVLHTHFNGMDAFLGGCGNYPHMVLSTTPCNKMKHAAL